MKTSAGVLLYRHHHNHLEFFLVHPGGPFWARKDLGAWSIPKGEINEEEEALPAALREFEEETGSVIRGEFLALQPVKLKSGKLIMAWAVKGDLDPEKVASNSFSMEWPPRSGKRKEFPEVDKAAWFAMDAALEKINPAQVAFLTELEALLNK